MAITKNIGMLCLAIYLLLIGFSAFIPAMAGVGTVASILAIVAGACILVGK